MQNFLITLLVCSLTMSIPALIYMVLMPHFVKRYSIRGCYYTWLIVVAGLIIPFRPHFDYAVIKVITSSEAAMPLVQVGNTSPVTIPVINGKTMYLSGSSWWQVGGIVWLAGVVLFGIYHGVKHYQFIKMTKRWSEEIENEATVALFQQLKTELGISRKIELYLCPCVDSPMMIGLINPRVLLPKLELEQGELVFILKHELIHYKRKDLWYKASVLLATAIHWFNPIVYLMARGIETACELSCDAETMLDADIDTRQFYSKTILNVVRSQSKVTPVLATNFYGGKKGMKERILSIMDTRTKKIGVAVICAMVIITMGTSLFVTANTKKRAEPAGAKTVGQLEDELKNNQNQASQPETYAGTQRNPQIQIVDNDTVKETQSEKQEIEKVDSRRKEEDTSRGEQVKLEAVTTEKADSVMVAISENQDGAQTVTVRADTTPTLVESQQNVGVTTTPKVEYSVTLVEDQQSTMEPAVLIEAVQPK